MVVYFLGLDSKRFWKYPSKPLPEPSSLISFFPSEEQLSNTRMRTSSNSLVSPLLHCFLHFFCLWIHTQIHIDWNAGPSWQGNTYPFKPGSWLKCCGVGLPRTEHDVPYLRGTAKKYHQRGRHWNSWARSGLASASDGGKQPVPSGRQVGDWQLLIFYREREGLS